MICGRVACASPACAAMNYSTLPSGFEQSREWAAMSGSTCSAVHRTRASDCDLILSGRRGKVKRILDEQIVMNRNA